MNTTAEPAPRRRRTLTFAAVAVVLLVGVIAVAVTSGRGGRSPSPHKAPTFTVADLRDPTRQVTLSSLRGTPVVLNFWATWCVPCRKEMPDLEAVHHALGSKVAFIGINNRDSRREAIKFLRDTGVTYPSGFDPGGQIAAAYAVLGMPTTVFISADGTVLSKHTGELHAKSLRAAISRYFKITSPG